jgi:predicted nucleic acid-binding protein
VTNRPVVSNSSPLIALERVHRLELLSLLFSSVLIPPGVAIEVGPSITELPWLIERQPRQPIGAHVERAGLQSGETEAIALAIETRAQWVMLDDEPARRFARQLGLPVIGTVGLLLAAKRRTLITSVRPILDDLIAADFRLSLEIYASVLSEAGEGP